MPVVSKEKKEPSLDTGEREMSSALVGPNHDVSGSAVSLVKSHVKATLDTIRTISSLGMIVLNCHHRKSTGLESDTVLLETQEKIEGTFKTEHETLGRVQQLLNISSSLDGTLAIEVRGQSSNSLAKSLLIEKWIFQVVHRSQNPVVHRTTLQYLTQAIRSFLHFSQITSWSVSCGGHLPFRLVYRLNSDPSQRLFSDILPSPDTHKFPLVQLSHSSGTLEVTVHYLPRLDEIPFVLVGDTTVCDSQKSNCTKVEYSNGHTCNDESANDKSDNDDIQLKVKRFSLQSSEQSCLRISSESSSKLFPFSSPTPSPFSPKFSTLSNLKDSTPTKQNTSGRTTYKGVVTRRVLSKTLSHDLTSKHSEGKTQSVPPFVSHWKNGVRPPGASSPVPSCFTLNGTVLTRDELLDNKEFKRLKRRSCGINMKVPSRPLPVRSMSLPAAVPNLCLLGTFEESVLNGRIDPFGYVDGFTAELGASGSFCPQHITLPVTAAFFNLSDDGGPSPYLGQIDLSNVGKRGYRVPNKGTVQLTLFNPNKTVVKIFIVTYDHTDMPHSTSTFLRQKTVTRPSLTDSVWPSLHYLIHLRFLCSKSCRLYLHTDIKLIFARRAPDTDPDNSKISLLTTTEGPIDPKYGPLAADYNP